MKKRRSVTLIELVISLGLLAFLLSSLFFWYRTLTKQAGTLHEKKWPIVQEKYCFQRLNKILPKITSSLHYHGDNRCLFYFDHGVYSEPKLSGIIVGELFVDQSKRLCLQMWPHPDRGRKPTETTILLDDVTSFECAFYCPPELESKPIDPEAIGYLHPHVGKWQDIWHSDYPEPPALMKIVITREEKEKEREVEFFFDLEKTILYPPTEKHV